MPTALVTGAGGGLGAAIAARLAAEGYGVTVLDVTRERAEAAAIPGALALGADVTDERAAAEAIAAHEAHFGAPPDLLVNNAGIVRFGPLLDHAAADFRRVLDVNVTGVFIMSQAAARRMVPRGSGAIVNVTSLNAVAPSPDAGAYPASKAAVALLTQHFALVLGPHGIRVNCVAPGFIDAGMSAPIYADPEVRRVRGGAVPLGTIGRAEDVAEAVLFLASERARYTTGQQLMVDGGVSFSLKNHLPRKAPS